MLSILILTKSPFSKRDYTRFGIDVLNRYFDVKVLDFTPLLEPEYWEESSGTVYKYPGYTAIHHQSDLDLVIKEMNTGKRGVAIDYLSQVDCSDAECIRNKLRNHGFLMAIVRCGIMPNPSQNINGLRNLKRYLNQEDLTRKIRNKFRRKSTKKILPDIAILSGLDGLNEPNIDKAKHKIWAHSFDYDLYLHHQQVHEVKPTEPYAVFLDQDMVYHPEYLSARVDSPVTENGYYKALNTFLDQFESATGLNVIFAAHPRSNYELRPYLLRGRDPIKNKTAELIQGSSLVFCHASTALNFAILWHKPIVLLTTDELIKSWLNPHIIVRSEILNVPVINMNKSYQKNIDIYDLTSTNEEAYMRYKERFIKKEGTQEYPVWEIFSDYALKIFEA